MALILFTKFNYFMIILVYSPLRWLLPWEAGLSERVSLQTSSHHHDHPQRTISDEHTALSLHKRLPPRHLEPRLVRINYTNWATQLHGRHIILWQ